MVLFLALVQLVIVGGHETDSRDHGRPVALVAAGLGVPPQVFRDAFSRVHPAPLGQRPADDQVHRNKQVLLKALSRYGVDNDRLDEVSNYYRYDERGGKLWRNHAAKLQAKLKGGKVVKIIIVDAGAGYTTPPEITVPGAPNAVLEATIHFGKDLSTNGSIESVKIVHE